MSSHAAGPVEPVESAVAARGALLMLMCGAFALERGRCMGGEGAQLRDGVWPSQVPPRVQAAARQQRTRQRAYASGPPCTLTCSPAFICVAAVQGAAKWQAVTGGGQAVAATAAAVAAASA